MVICRTAMNWACKVRNTTPTAAKLNTSQRAACTALRLVIIISAAITARAALAQNVSL